VRRGAASWRAVPGSGPVGAAVRAAAQVRHRGAVVGGRAPPGAVTRARSGRPAGVAGREMSGRRPGRSLPCLPRPIRGGAVRPTGRADVQCPRVRCPGVRGIQVSGRTGSGVRGAAAALSAPWTLEWLGGGPPRPGAAGRRAAWSVGGVVACLHRAGREGMVRCWPWLARPRVDRSPGPPLGRRPAAAPPWPQRADPGAGLGPGCRPVAGEHGTEQVLTGPPQGVLGRSLAWC
jgi:hypothetical protein